MYHYLLSEMKILFLERKYQNKSSLYFRVTIDKKRSNNIPTYIYFTNLDFFNSEKQTFEGNKNLSEQLIRITHKLQSIFLDLTKPTTKAVVDVYLGKRTAKENKHKENKEIDKYLCEDKIKLLESTDFEKIQKFADVFLILVHTGLNYSDLKKIDWKQLIKTSEGKKYIEVNRNKTSVKSIIPLLPTTIKVLEKYNYCLPLFTRQHFNFRLKDVGKIICVPSLSLKFGRKSMANMLLERGVSVEVTARVLGHTNTNIVQKHYATIREKRVISEISSSF